MNYSIYKDDNTISTVERIQRILDNIGIEIEEAFYAFNMHSEFEPFTSRIRLGGVNSIGTNGKGTTRENCRASAYSEFMERLENQSFPDSRLSLISDKFYFAPDEKIYDNKKNEYVKKYKKEELVSTLLPNKNYVPYFNIKNNKISYIPALIKYYGSNGMSAGNTPEEALVQGFSEVCERYAYKQVFLGNISMPDIPKKYYNNYDNINNLIKYAELCGWEVSIKDASLGLGLPVVCTVYKNKSKKYFTYNFGSQPSLPVAIERTLTEFFQGGFDKLDNLKIVDLKGFSKEDFKHIYPYLNSENILLKTTGKFYNLFYKNDAKYKFSKNSWIKQDKLYTNKELLKFITDSIKRITDNDIYVRDVSFLDFPAYHIFIPDISDDVYFNKKRLNMHKWVLYTGKNEDASYDMESLISAILFKFKFHLGGCHIVNFMPDEFILLLCYMIKGDIDNILKYCNILTKHQDKKFVADNKNFIDIIYHYYSLKQQKENNTMINNIIENLYTERDVNRFKNLMDNLNFEYVKNIIAKSKENIPEMPKNQEQINLDNKISEINKKLVDRYIQNTPNQMDLAKVFDFSDLKEV